MIKTTAPGKVVLWGEYAVLAGAAAGVRLGVVGAAQRSQAQSAHGHVHDAHRHLRRPPI